MSLTMRVLAALVLSLGAGLVVRAYPAPAFLALVSVAEPIGTLWVNAIRMTVVPLVVSLLVTGVASCGNMQAVRAIGLRALVAFLGLLLVCAAFSLAVVPSLFVWFHVDGAMIASLRGTSAVTTVPTPPAFADWVVSIVPTNPVKAAADGALLPLVVFVLAFALGLLTVRADRRDAVIAFFGGAGDAMLAVVRFVIGLAPIGVFALMLPVASRTGLAAAGALGYYVAVMALAQTILIALFYPIAAVAGRIPVTQFARAVLPAQAVAVASSSSLASLPALIDGADQRLRLPTSVTDVVLPLAVSSFKVGTPLVWLIAAAFLGRLYGVSLGPTQLFVVVLTAILTSFSTPGVPHGWLLAISPLVAAMGIPSEGIGLLIAVDAIPDIFATTLNVTGDLLAAGIVARKSD
ncbi:MAG TPA: cation:dicarboxylase symporter family transporter [Vicinamibacterales bacterium]|nr:cation:dicarboxylase symporter family transporter [Vicinamibacterales bacterium]